MPRSETPGASFLAFSGPDQAAEDLDEDEPEQQTEEAKEEFEVGHGAPLVQP